MNRGELAEFTNFGRRTVHITAPGQDILSTIPDNLYAFFSGTSQAAPFVAGVAALLKAQKPKRDWKEIKNLLVAGGEQLDGTGLTITGSHLNALGSMKCNRTKILAPLVPTRDYGETVAVDEPFYIAALSINCGRPSGKSLKVRVRGSGNETITLVDKGAGADLARRDGVFSGSFRPSNSGRLRAGFR